MEKKPLFICGCPRSGTTALWRLMISHPKIVLGNERYLTLLNKKKDLTPELFRKDEFFDFQPRETNHGVFPEAGGYYRTARARFDAADWIGDKLPTAYLRYDNIDSCIPGANFIFIVRNIIDVAASYQARVVKGSWAAHRDYKQAIHDWQQSIELTLAFAAKAGSSRVHIVSYEDMFLQTADIRPLFEKLNLRFVQNASAMYRTLIERSAPLEKNRGASLDSAKRHYIAQNAPFDAFREILRQRLTLPAL